MTPFLSELTGSAILITMGGGVNANIVLSKTKGNNSGWLVICFGWAMAAFVAVYTSSASSGAHLNPAITIAFATLGKIKWAIVPSYVLAQLLGSMAGATIVWLVYRQHFNQTENAESKLAVFCTGPAIRTYLDNLISEIVATFVLIFGALHIATPANSLGAIDALPVALLILGIGLSLGGTTGFAINPTRDFGPRLMHYLLPIPHKRDSDWNYAWIPVLGPVIGSVLAAFVFKIM